MCFLSQNLVKVHHKTSLLVLLLFQHQKYSRPDLSHPSSVPVLILRLFSRYVLAVKQKENLVFRHKFPDMLLLPVSRLLFWENKISSMDLFHLFRCNRKNYRPNRQIHTLKHHKIVEALCMSYHVRLHKPLNLQFLYLYVL